MRLGDQVLPPSVVLYSPRSPPPFHRGPGAATYTTLESRGSMMTSLHPVYSPTLIRLGDQVLPPSVVLYSPRSPPPFHRGPGAATYTTLESRGSMMTSLHPVYSPTLIRLGDQVLPPSVVLYSPRSPPPFHRGPGAATYTTLESRGSMMTSLHPVYSPTLIRLGDQVLPPSVVLYSPRSPPPFHRGPGAATYTTLESRGSMMTSLHPVYSPTLIRLGDQVLPPSVVLYSPRSPPPFHRGPGAATY